jgi:hypothetical protein
MAGACEVDWLIWVWPFFIISIVLSTLILFKIDKLFLIALFSSFIGIELLTNAMRQGFSIAILFLGFAFFLRRNYIVFTILAMMSLLFHQASFVIIFIFLASRVSYKLFIPIVFFGIVAIFGTTILDFAPGILSLKGSVYKYIPHAGEDFIVRFISIINVLLTFVAYLFVNKGLAVKDTNTINCLVNIITICLIVSIVPYLGFRIIYGVYPLFLLLTYFSLKRHSQISYQYLSIVTCANVLVTVIWLCGSAHMRAIPFVSLI